jgi:hypothetical protein
MKLAVLGCIAASTTLAFQYGWTRGATEVDQWTFAGAAAALDLLKTGLPVAAVGAWEERHCRRAATAWAGFALLTALSLWCAFGLTATQLAEKATGQNVASTTYGQRKADLDQLVKERATLPAFQPRAETAETTAREAVNRAAESVKAECTNRGPRCRELEGIERKKRDELTAITTDLATAKTARDLDGKIAVARDLLDKADLRTATKETDPQSAAFAKITGADQGLVAAAAHVILALGIEFGSGLGFWLVFGHGGRQREVASIPAGPALPSPGPIAAQPMGIETPADSIEQFFLEAVRPLLGQRVSGAAMYARYETWCTDRGTEPVSANRFGRLAPWRKERIGGKVWYLDASLADDRNSNFIVPGQRRTASAIPPLSPGCDCPVIAPGDLDRSA